MKFSSKIIKNKHQGKENRRYNIDDYKQVFLLRKQGFSYNKIAKILNLSCTTVQLWIKTFRKPRMFYAKKMQKVLPLKSKRLSVDLA